MDSTTEKQTIVVCRPADAAWPPGVPSERDRCDHCGAEVWRARSSPAGAKAICLDCFEKINPREVEFTELTEAQREEISEYYRTHPGEKRNDALKAFESVTAEDLEGIEGLCVVVERLCASLRDLRRSSPKEFFGQPVERLYDSLEAALSSFYRAAVSREQEEKQNPS